MRTFDAALELIAAAGELEKALGEVWYGDSGDDALETERTRVDQARMKALASIADDGMLCTPEALKQWMAVAGLAPDVAATEETHE